MQRARHEKASPVLDRLDAFAVLEEKLIISLSSPKWILNLRKSCKIEYLVKFLTSTILKHSFLKTLTTLPPLLFSYVPVRSTHTFVLFQLLLYYDNIRSLPSPVCHPTSSYTPYCSPITSLLLSSPSLTFSFQPRSPYSSYCLYYDNLAFPPPPFLLPSTHRLRILPIALLLYHCFLLLPLPFFPFSGDLHTLPIASIMINSLSILPLAFPLP